MQRKLQRTNEWIIGRLDISTFLILELYPLYDYARGSERLTTLLQYSIIYPEQISINYMNILEESRPSIVGAHPMERCEFKVESDLFLFHKLLISIMIHTKRGYCLCLLLWRADSKSKTRTMSGLEDKDLVDVVTELFINTFLVYRAFHN